jgi:hypothetical protein
VFVRSIQRELELWLRGAHRKPLILRGARQVGKTTAVQIFSRQFRQFLSFNLERKEDRDLFDRDQSFDTLVKALFFSRNCSVAERSTLIFIDEIQNSEQAVSALRYFYEEAPEIAVIAAGSLLEVMIDTYRSSFPVGRVEFAYMHPLTFREFLTAKGESAALEAFDTVPLPDYANTALRNLFHTYVLLGGMPEVIQRHVERDDLSELSAIYESLMASYIDDAGKYAHGRSAFQVFWVREKNQSQAEVDFVLPYNGQVVPVEVKSGSSGRLRSLHQYVAQSGCTTALRLYAGPLRVDSLETPAGHPFRLLSLPYFLAAQIEQYLAWMENG